MKVYLDHAATTPIDPRVADVMIEIIKNQSGNPSSIHEKGRQARAIIEQARKTIAEHLNSSIGEIFFTSSATESNNTILRKSVKDLKVTRIISSPLEHHCVKDTLEDLEEEGIELILMNVDQNGQICHEEFEKALAASDKTTLVSLMYGNNEIGTINDIESLTSIAKKYNAFFHSDSVQVFGKYPINVKDLGIDFMSATAHKINGPKGIGMMYISNNCTIKPFLTGGGQERNMRAGTENIYGIAGLASCFDISMKEHKEREQAGRALNQFFRDEIVKIDPRITFNGDFENGLYHVCSVNFPNSPKNGLMIYNLDIKGICASSGSACSSGSNQGSHVIKALNLKDDVVTIRFSFSHLNTKEEVQYVLDCLEEILEVETVA